METVSHATASRSSAYDALPMIRDTLARTRSFSATARQTGYPETTIRLLLDPPKARVSYSPTITPAAIPYPSPTALSPREIIMLCCAEEGLSYAEIMSESRLRTLTRPRQRFMWLMRKAKPNLSYPEIARRFNKKDHTTVLHAIRVTEERYATCASERAKLDALVAALRQVEAPMQVAAELDAEINQLLDRLVMLRGQRAAISVQAIRAAA